MKAIDCLKERRSIRDYKDKKIPKKVLKEIIDCGRLAPSARNVQPWEFIVVTKDKKLKELASLAEYGGFIRKAAACVVVVCKDSKYYLEDGCIASENILLAARAHGIGSCWVAGDKKNYADDVLDLLDVEEDHKLVSLLSLGYPKEEFPKPHGKRELDEVLHWEKF